MKSITIGVVVLCTLLAATSVQGAPVTTAETYDINQALTGMSKTVPPVQLFNGIGSWTNVQMQSIGGFLGRLFIELLNKNICCILG
jgi:hypothetical protein